MSHRASLVVSAVVLKAVTGWIARHRRRPGFRPAQRAGTVHTEVALLLRWLRHRLDLRTLAIAGLSIATAYRYLHEALDVIAAHAPALDDVLEDAHASGLPFRVGEPGQQSGHGCHGRHGLHHGRGRRAWGWQQW